MIAVRRATHVERLAYTRTQAAEALGVSRSTFDRRLLPLLETVDMPWGTRLVPVDGLERFVKERRGPARGRTQTAPPGRPAAVPAELVRRIQAENASGKSLHQIARELNATETPTAHGGGQWWPSTVRAVLRRAPLAKTASAGLGSPQRIAVDATAWSRRALAGTPLTTPSASGEHLEPTQEVAGSSPASSTRKDLHARMLFSGGTTQGARSTRRQPVAAIRAAAER